MINKPYVKQYDSEGFVTNPIVASYVSPFKNRKQRRQSNGRHRGNGKNYHLSVHPKARYHRTVQEIIMPDGKIKRIEHLILC